MEWCPRCQKQVNTRITGAVRKEGNKVSTRKTYHCIECSIFLKTEVKEEG